LGSLDTDEFGIVLSHLRPFLNNATVVLNGIHGQDRPRGYKRAKHDETIKVANKLRTELPESPQNEVIGCLFVVFKAGGSGQRPSPNLLGGIEAS
jgi:hypothetical protein